MCMDSRRNRLARLLVPASLTVVLVAFAGCPLLDSTDLYIINHSNVLIHAVYVSPVENRIAPDYPDHNDWGANLIEGQTDLGYDSVIAVSGIPNGTYDILVVATYTPLYGGDIARFIQWGVTFDGGCYQWELRPDGKSDDGTGEIETQIERTGAVPPHDVEPNLWVEYFQG